MAKLTRRAFGAAAGVLASGALLDACALATKRQAKNGARLTPRLRGRVTTTLKSGALGLGAARDGVVQMPAVMSASPVPLVVFLHGATQSGAAMLRRIGPAAAEAGVVVLAPDSRGTTWDAINGPFGDDVEFLSRAIEYVFERVDVDRSRFAIGGFSDGASYALSLGLANGDLCPKVVACSPGFVVPARVSGRPRFFISHGTSDQILPIDECSRVIVHDLRSIGYDVTFREFDGRHEVPPDIAREAMAWI